MKYVQFKQRSNFKAHCFELPYNSDQSSYIDPIKSFDLEKQYRSKLPASKQLHPLFSHTASYQISY